ncbi:MAG TPA: carboxypeptidase regulatory-like domain-containing protein [Candidatus Angelobacter sp.]|nr:carboxypeptidase regulatory-like domain-containing protein [Candidatus Angelobacter sp.]
MKFRSCYSVILSLAVLVAGAALSWAQSTVSTGSVQGTVTDPNGAVVPNANIVVTNRATGRALKLATNSSGTFSSGALIPGDYEVRVEVAGFQTAVTTVPVQVGVVASVNTKLTVGKTSEMVEVSGSAVQVNTEQSTVQGVLTAQQIDNLPVNGRNFLDLAQLEPGVQIQDGGNFDPTKNGYSSISFGGRFGRTARIEVDGIDISDETVGTTTQNIPAGAIQEFQVSQSSLDLSTELTSSGAVNVVTRSGSNKWHGEGFYLFRDHSIAADIGDHDIPFQRNQFGGRLGGPIVKDKLFFFFDAERVKQDLINQVATGDAFTNLAAGFNSPFRDTNGIAKLDWQVKPDNYHVFYRFSYEQNRAVKAFVPNAFQPFANVDHTPVHVGGIDFNTGSYTHAVRFGFTKFKNGITDAVAGSNIFNPAPGIELAIGGDPNCLGNAFDPFCSGPNFLAPQKTYQANSQVKYDGSKTIKSHIIRYGFGYNHIQGGGFAEFLGLGPAVSSPVSSIASGVLPCTAPGQLNCVSNAFPGGLSNPLNYPVETVTLGNGIGFSSEKPAFGLPGGGLGPDNRIQWYVGDSWKVTQRLTLTYGLRYVHDTGRTDTDLGPLPLLNQLSPGLGNTVRTPAANFAPQLGFAWDPTSSRKTVIRGGAGLYYENSIFNNNLFNRPGRLAQGLFLNTPPACSNGNPASVALPGGPTVTPSFCGQTIGSVFPQIIQLQQQLQAATTAAGPAVNAGFVGNTQSAFGGVVLFAPNYQTPRSVQMNIGLQHEFAKGVVLTADYIRNVETHSLLAIDQNHVGDVRFFNLAAANAAVSATNTKFGCASVDCSIGKGATIADYVAAGLGSGTESCAGGPCPTAAFAGKNSNFGVVQMLEPIGRSVYNGLQTSIRANVANPITGIKNLSWQFSYSFSRFVGAARDGDFINTATDNNNPTSFIGPNALDRTHQFSFGGYLDLPWSVRFGAVSHFYSPLPVTLLLPTSAGGIFSSDVTGDGSGDGSGVYPQGDVLPGTNIGAFGRGVSASGINNVITNYNNVKGNTPTPAGQVLLNNNVLTLSQLQKLGGVQQPLALAPNGQTGLDWLRALDLKLSWPKQLKEGLTIEPSVSAYNVLNFANFDAPGATLSGILSGTPGSVNGTTQADRNNGLAPTRTSVGSGVFGIGSPRVIEFGLKLDF